MITPQQRRLSPIEQGLISIAFVLVALVVIGYIASLGSSKAPPGTKGSSGAIVNTKSNKADVGVYQPDIDFSAQPEETMRRMRKCARDSGGDFSKLSYQDQGMFDAVTGGYGRNWLKELAAHPEKYK